MEPIETRLSLRHSTVYFRIRNGEPEILFEHGCAEGPAWIKGAAELAALMAQLRLLELQLVLQHNSEVTG